MTFSLSCLLNCIWFCKSSVSSISMSLSLELKMDSRWTPSVSVINEPMCFYNGPWTRKSERKKNQKFSQYCAENGLFFFYQRPMEGYDLKVDSNQQGFWENKEFIR